MEVLLFSIVVMVIVVGRKPQKRAQGGRTLDSKNYF